MHALLSSHEVPSGAAISLHRPVVGSQSCWLHWSLAKLPEQIERIENGEDVVFWEIEKFVRLALKANPNVLETLWTPVVLYATDTGQRLRELRRSSACVG